MDWTSWVDKIATFMQEKGADILGGTFKAIGNVGGFVFDAVVAMVFAIYCLFCKEILARQGRRLIYAFLPEKFCDETVRIMRLTSNTFANFISGQFLEACILGSLFAIAMLIFRMPYVPLISVLIAVTALVPIVGAFAGCIVGAFLILVEAGIVKALWFVVMFLVIQQFEGNVIYPKVVGKSVGLPGMWVLFAVSVGGELMGVAGMFVMIPIVSVLYTLLREITNRRLEAKGIPREKLQDQPPDYRVKLGRNANKPRKQWKFGKKKTKSTDE
jgi:predicted PurR-regulated permease PerM